MSRGRLYRTVAGYLAGVTLGAMCITLVFLGMRSVMEIGGACAEGGPYVPVQPCPDGAPIALIGGMFGAFGAAGLMIWFGSRLGRDYVALVFLGWPALFISLGFNFLQFGLNPPWGGGVEWGFLIPGVLFWVMGFVPLGIGIWGWREARRGMSSSRTAAVNRLSDSATLSNRIEFAPNAFGSARPVPAPGPRSDPDDVDEALVDKLERLSTLHADGSLSDEEFAAAKARILANQSLDA
ncbi:MAG TPA: SHOCT domain-containing protein [Candidatus Limnocylindrales bacterium]|nr:SHOCT domain-containing protein [Candidatus Limnocylindrales bacterium]